MKISLVLNLLFPGDKYQAIAYPIQTAMSIFWSISNKGHIVQIINVSDPIDKIILKLKIFRPDIIYNLAEGKTDSKTRLAMFPELFEQLKIPYIGGNGYLSAISLDKYLSKKIVEDLGIKTPKGNLYQFDYARKDIMQIGNWEIKFPVIIKPNYRGDSEGIDTESIVNDYADLKRIISKKVRQFPEGVIVEEIIPGRDIGTCFLKDLGENGVLPPAELVIRNKDNNLFNIIDFNLKNYAIKSTTIQQLLIRIPKDLPPFLLRNLATISKKIFTIFQINDFCRIDFRVSEDNTIYFLELNPYLTMLNNTHMFFVAKEKYGMSYSDVFDHIIKKAAARWGIKFYRNNKGLFSQLAYKLNRKYYALKYSRLNYSEK